MTYQINDWIVNWFMHRNPGAQIDSAVDYYEKRLIDSFGIIELIDALEEKFAIRFSDQDFKQPQFRTINGLCALVLDKQEGAGQTENTG
ncbi:MAG: acyl carrier protein [Chromatiales bacterium]|jgi:acyl carrier protein